ncbi:hypothetical protein KBX08_04550 [Micromonospora sp. H61]|uniref:hypothetical protein n=1 Tax=Micromonospora sp. H61 TaxID=2824888 RepID=UPI001B3765CA|nr:hypothetical protein [Micromonospora sp. H61]MBQ0989360.1 hypothetical protein [Micromonospora sp. H61]
MAVNVNAAPTLTTVVRLKLDHLGCHPDVLAAQRRERARIRSERQRRWGQPDARAA